MATHQLIARASTLIKFFHSRLFKVIFILPRGKLIDIIICAGIALAFSLAGIVGGLLLFKLNGIRNAETK